MGEEHRPVSSDSRSSSSPDEGHSSTPRGSASDSGRPETVEEEVLHESIHEPSNYVIFGNIYCMLGKNIVYFHCNSFDEL